MTPPVAAHSALKGKSRVEISRMANHSAAEKLEDAMNTDTAATVAARERAAEKARTEKLAHQNKKRALVEKEQRRQQQAKMVKL